MNNNNASSSFIAPAYLPILLISLFTAIISSCVLSPLYTQISSDVMLMYTILPMVLEYLIIIFDIIYISLLFTVISSASYYSLKQEESKRIGLYLTVGVIILKQVLNLTVSSIIDNYIDIPFDIYWTLLLIVIDALTILVVRAIAIKKSKEHLSHAKRMQKAAKYLDNVIYDENTEIYPFGSLLNIKNPIIYPIFIGTVITVLILIIQRLYADFIVLGLPTSFFEVIEIIIAYISDVLLGIIGYVAAYYAAVYTFIRKQTNI